MALTEDLTFMLGDTGVILNSTSGLPFVDIDKVTGLDSADYRETERDWEGNDGGFMDAEFEKGRQITLSGTAYVDGSSAESFLDTLKANYAPSAVLIPFYYKAPGVSERVLFVKPRGVRYDWDPTRRTGQIPVQFGLYAEDPRLYTSGTASSATIPLGATVTTGFGFSFGFPFGFGGVSSTTDQVVINVGGNRPTPPVFTITGPVTDPRILNDTMSTEMRFSIVLGVSDVLVVDAKYKTVTLNGSANRRDALLSPDWFMLAKGANTIRYRAGSSNPASTLTITYRDAWR